LTQDKCYRGGELDEAFDNTLTQVVTEATNMSLSAKRECLARIHGRYQRAGRPHKQRNPRMSSRQATQLVPVERIAIRVFLVQSVRDRAVVASLAA
jgi:hypothetical protein